MRALVVAGLVVFHSAVVFAAGASWFVKDPRPSVGFTAFLLWGSLWGMPLLFLVSGMGVRYAMRSRPAGAFAAERLARLGIPFATGMVLLVPPMFYLERAAQPGFHQPYWRFWLSFMNIPAIARGLLPHGTWTSGGASFDPAHLWFLYVLLAFSLALLPLFGYLRSPRGMLRTGRAAALAARHPLATIALAAVPVMVIEAAFGPDANTGGWERLAYALPFAYGFLIASDTRFESALACARWPALVAAAAATAGLLGWASALTGAGTGVMTGATPGWAALQGLAGWAWLAAIAGFAAALTARRRQPGTRQPRPAAPRPPRWQRAARYANQAVLPFYLLHEPVIVAAAGIIVRWHAPIGVKYPALVAASFTATLALYELVVRRYRLTRFLFGMKPTNTPVKTTTAAQCRAASHANPSWSVKGPASLPMTSRCDPVPSGVTPASLARARRP
jgi:acyltransferase-like protein